MLVLLQARGSVPDPVTQGVHRIARRSGLEPHDNDIQNYDNVRK